MDVRKLILAAAIFFSCQSPFAWSQYQKPYSGSHEAYVAFTEGRKLLVSGDAAHAAEYFKKAIGIDPNFAVAESDYGVALSAIGQKNEAIAHLKQATIIEPANPMYWENLAIGFQAKGDLNDAAQTYEHYLQIAPEAADRAKVHAWLNTYHRGGIAASENATAPDYVASLKPPWMRWDLNQMPLRVYIGSGVGVPGFMPEFVDLIPTACNDWAHSMQGRLTFRPVQNPNEANITIEWTNDISKTKDPGEGGHTQLWGHPGHLDHAAMVILTNDPTATVRMTPQRMSWILHHEIGHALGLSGHSPSPDDAMYFNCPPTSLAQYATLTDRDLHTIAKFYGLSN